MSIAHCLAPTVRAGRSVEPGSCRPACSKGPGLLKHGPCRVLRLSGRVTVLAQNALDQLTTLTSYRADRDLALALLTTVSEGILRCSASNPSP